MAELTACFNEDDSMEATRESVSNFDYMPAVVTKSSSLMSNECLTSRSSFDTDAPLPGRPSTGLKLVFKRQSTNSDSYEIKSNIQFDMQHSNDSWGMESVNSIAQATSNVLPNGKRIPRRQSARKVKFIFSDQESDEDEKTSRRAKKRVKPNSDVQTPLSSLTNSIITENTTAAQFLPHVQQIQTKTVASTYQHLESDESEDEYFQELLRKNMPQAQTVPPNSIPNAIQLAQQHFLQNQLLLNSLGNVQNVNNNFCNQLPEQQQPTRARRQVKKPLSKCPSEEVLALNPKRKITKKSKSTAAQTRTRRVPSTSKATTTTAAVESKARDGRLPPLPKVEPEQRAKFKAAPAISFLPGELIKSSLLEKHRILNSQPVVQMEHSKPFPIALVESATNIVETKALLFMHLFQSIASPCIGCPECSGFMTCTEFSRHIHADEEDEEGGLVTQREKPERTACKSYKILPYRINEEEELSESDMNIWREFGRRCAQFKRLSQQGAEAKPNKTVLATKDINNNNVVCVANRNCGPGETPKISVKNKFEFEEWDSRENESFLITRERLEGDQICTVKCEGASNKENVHFFMEENEDLHLSEDESESHDSFNMSNDNFHLNMSESSIESEEVVTCPVKKLLDNMVETVAQNSDGEASEAESMIQNLVKEGSITDETGSSKERRPTILERYFNLYDNLTNDMMLYICDNSLTVIPDSYVLYINNKREVSLKDLKLAKTKYHHGKWLQQILDLECKSQRL